MNITHLQVNIQDYLNGMHRKLWMRSKNQFDHVHKSFETFEANRWSLA